MENLRLAFCGPSGSGKTTLATFLEKETGVKFIPNSAGLIFSDEDKKILKEKYGYEGTGHRNVINLSNINPDFGWDFQMAVLKARLKILYSNSSFIIDRSPIDNIVYMLLQTSHNQTEDKIRHFVELAKGGLETLTHIVWIEPWGKVEDNNSRVSNIYYQTMVNSVFKYVLDARYTYSIANKIHTLGITDLENRKDYLLKLINH